MSRKLLTAFVSAAVLAGMSDAPSARALLLPADTMSQGTSAPAKLTLDEIIARYVAAKGGDRIKTVQSVKQVSQITAQGIPATQTIYSKRPNLVRQELLVNGMTVVNAFDGTTAWLLNPFAGKEPQVMSGPDLDAIKEQSVFESPLVDYKARGYSVELVGTDAMDGKSVHHLKVTSRSQQVQQVYLDAETFLETKIVSDSPAGVLELELADYRDVQGFKMPYSIRSSSSGTVMMTAKVQTIEINAPMDAALFKMPAKLY